MKRANWTFFVLMLAAGACLEIERVPKRDAGVLPPSDAGSDAVFEAGPCIQACIDKTPEGAEQFASLSACVAGGQLEACGDACAADAGDVPPSECPVPGLISPSVSCNSCLKDLCCDLLTGCFASSACLNVALCAAGCPAGQ